MKSKSHIFRLAALLALAAPALCAEKPAVKPQPYYGRIGARVAGMLPNFHVMHEPFDDEVSRRAWTNLVTYYDFDHSVFLKSDLDEFAKRDRSLDDELKNGDVSFGFDVYRVYCERLHERIDFATNLLAKGEWDFSVDEDYRFRRKDAPWPETREEAEEHWRKRMKNEVLAQVLARELDAADAAKEAEESAKEAEESAKEDSSDEKKEPEAECGSPEENTTDDEKKPEADANPDEEKKPEDAEEDEEAPVDEDGDEIDLKRTPEENLIKKYRQYITVLTEPDEEAVLQHYLSAVSRAYDPHTDYMSPTTKDDFDMGMNLTLCGVGAVLSMDDGALKISEVMPGGPMATDGRIKKGDKITGVGQGDGKIEDIMWQPMKKSIKKIRGEKGTRVTLEIQPRSDPSGVTRRLIELVRDEIKLEDQAATGRVETVTREGTSRKLGYVFLPGFYGTMDKKPGEEGARSSAEDVRKLVLDLDYSGVEGLVLDLRGNGGGALIEAIRLAGIFVDRGPVVQTCDIRVRPYYIERGNVAAFRKPLVVLVDRASASASEITAGHLRDTGRAVVLGDHTTHGKGTVQSVMDLDNPRYGSMKITTARFYRIDGRSTQLRGVESDITLPSLLDSLDIGEDKLTYALPFTRIGKLGYAKAWNADEFVGRLADLSKARVSNNPRYVKHLENVAGMKAIADREFVPLEREKRLAMMKADREIREQDEKKDSEKEKKNARIHRNQPKDDDIVLDEAFEILYDLIELEGGAQMPRPKFDWYEAFMGF